MNGRFSAQGPLGLFGGTFDPIHFGHLRLAEELGAALGCPEVRFIPAGTPPHRTPPQADARARSAMVAAAIAGNERFVLDAREVGRTDPCYAVDTLRAIRTEYGVAAPLVFFVGGDAFLGFPAWYRWTELFGLAHIAVAHRPGFSAIGAGLSEPLRAQVEQRQTLRVADLVGAPAGRIYFHALTPLDIAARQLRAACREGASIRYLTPDAVVTYIHDNRLYD